MAKYIVLLGPPGAGKGTQAEVISQKYGLVHVSSGDLFRENISAQTELGKMAKSYLDQGALVPDDVTIGMVRERLSRPDCKAGALLDGFPRTPAQASALNEILAGWGSKVDMVPYISVPADVLIERLSGRWVCKAEGHTYNEKSNPPKVAGKCDIDGSELYQREDDKPETVKNRIQVYSQQTAPLIDFYRKQGVLVEIDGTLSIEKVSEEMLAAIEKAE
ncbi:MAG TPA: adenylate kinase [Longilinea sp.]|nr:adenylate kinase [Longilinea sp.]